MTIKQRPRFIVFEGLDGAGKTKCSQQTAKLLGAKYLTTPSAELRKYRDAVVDSFGSCQEAIQFFYFATVLAASAEARSCLDDGKSVVLDRYFLSTQVYAECRGSQFPVDEALIKFLLPADVTVYLDVPLEIRRDRVAERGSDAADIEMLTTKADLYLRQAYRRLASLPVVGEWLPIDASEIPIEAIAQRVADVSLKRGLPSYPI
jgi:dTMP kinase